MNLGLFQRAVDVIRQSKYLVAITGAGVSVDSGIPPFRGDSGLWNDYDPDIYASIDGFLANPGRSWQFFLQLLDVMVDAKPNSAHRVLALMESSGILKSLITQNIDGLHSLAGQHHVIEIHGSLRNLICLECTRIYSSSSILLDSEDLPPRCVCGGILKPDAVLFGEPIPHEKYFSALEQIRSADVVILAGTSGLVHPVNELPEIAVRHGAKIIEINMHRTPLTLSWGTLHLEGSSSDIFTGIQNALYDSDD
ncbi:NAD-dependent deacylase [bacterium]|nr:NAD-dependent deacylase [candidate division CSSED10-310 bacterium]